MTSGVSMSLSFPVAELLPAVAVLPGFSNGDVWQEILGKRQLASKIADGSK